MMIKLHTLFGSALVSLSLLVTTVQASPAQDTTISRLMEVSDIKGLLKQTNKELKPMFDLEAQQILKNCLNVETLNAKQLVAASQISELMFKMNSDLVEDPKMYDLIKSNYKKTFTEEEALASIAFLETPIGQSINKKSSQLMGDLMIESQKYAQQAFNEPEKKTKFVADFNKIIEPLIDEQQ